MRPANWCSFFASSGTSGPGGAGDGYEANPYRVVRFKNTTPFALEPGPIAIYAGGSFVGVVLLCYGLTPFDSLRYHGLRPDVEIALWNQLDIAYFMRHGADEIAWHTRTCADLLSRSSAPARPAPSTSAP